MNRKTVRRTFMAATSALGVVGVLLTMLEMFSVDAFGLFRRASQASVALLLLLIIVLFALAGMCAYSFYAALYEDKTCKARMLTLKGTKDDVVFIHQETLDGFILSIIGKPEGVADISIDTNYCDMALDVKVTLKVDMNANIVAATQNMPTAIREQLETVNGIRLSGVSVIVASINVPENTEGMQMPWANGQEAEKTEEDPEEQK